MITWRCDVCERTRPDEKIAVETFDLSGLLSLPAGTLSRNIRYCADRPGCKRGIQAVIAQEKMKFLTRKKKES
jgi:hypothetical protein